MKVVIMAGGKGTRISELFPNTPKPLIPIDGIPVLEREIISLRNQGFVDITITVSYMHEKIIKYFGTGKRLGVQIDYYIEDNPLGNAGALFKLNLKEDFILINADSIFDIDFNRMIAYHKKMGGLVTLFTHPNSHPYDSGLIISDSSKGVIRWLTKDDDRPKYYSNRVNAGIHIINPRALEFSGFDPAMIGLRDEGGNIIKVDLDRHILKPLAGKGLMFCYNSPEYVKDMGTPERYHLVEKDYKAGIVCQKNLKNKQKAFFLDRDGTINKYVGFLKNIDDFELTEDAAEAIRLINASGCLAIVVTNQPVVARGELTFEGLEMIHKKLETELGSKGAYIDGIYFCPHHPDKGFEGEIAELKMVCSCRKPKPGLLFEASKDFNIDLSRSWMIGDSDADVEAGNSAGCKTAKIKEGFLLRTIKKILS